jgi:hypothetical protein
MKNFEAAKIGKCEKVKEATRLCHTSSIVDEYPIALAAQSIMIISWQCFHQIKIYADNQKNFFPPGFRFLDGRLFFPANFCRLATVQAFSDRAAHQAVNDR